MTICGHAAKSKRRVPDGADARWSCGGRGCKGNKCLLAPGQADFQAHKMGRSFVCGSVAAATAAAERTTVVHATRAAAAAATARELTCCRRCDVVQSVRCFGSNAQAHQPGTPAAAAGATTSGSSSDPTSPNGSPLARMHSRRRVFIAARRVRRSGQHALADASAPWRPSSARRRHCRRIEPTSPEGLERLPEQPALARGGQNPE